ncbi:MAG: hypothetical protein SFU99_08335 [Saprospiraceae bacterium]|nr:hypothetical protein [Saprospiraceae bacterium]
MTKNNALEMTFFDYDIINVPDSDNLAARSTGKNEKGIFILFQNQQDDREELELFLEKVLAAVQLNIQKDTTLLAITNPSDIRFVGLRQRFSFQHFICFGISPQELGIQFETKPYQALRHDGITFVFADDLQKIYEERQQGGKQMSGELWRVLKSMFL